MPLDYKKRMHLFQRGLLAISEALQPEAIHCHHCERMVRPSALRKASGAADPLALAMLALNVRVFRIENQAKGDTLMDTRGLAARFLPDLQMHFRGLEPGRVAAHLFNTARYIFERGDCIGDGQTIDGFKPEDRWRCQHEVAMVGPKRIVLDIDPGAPYAAGRRS